MISGLRTRMSDLGDMHNVPLAQAHFLASSLTRESARDFFCLSLSALLNYQNIFLSCSWIVLIELNSSVSGKKWPWQYGNVRDIKDEVWYKLVRMLVIICHGRWGWQDKGCDSCLLLWLNVSLKKFWDAPLISTTGWK